jgi:hypothetical protein
MVAGQPRINHQSYKHPQIHCSISKAVNGEEKNNENLQLTQQKSGRRQPISVYDTPATY